MIKWLNVGVAAILGGVFITVNSRLIRGKVEHFLSRILLQILLATAAVVTSTEWIRIDLCRDGRHLEEIAASKLLLVEDGLRADLELTAAITLIRSTHSLKHSKLWGLGVNFEK